MRYTRGSLTIDDPAKQSIADLCKKRAKKQKQITLKQVSYNCKKGQHSQCFTKSCSCFCGHKI